MAALVVERLKQLGVEDITVLAEPEERPNVIARVRGSAGAPVLILSGHLDTKPPGDLGAWDTDPFDPVVDDDRLVGLGSGDMKAGVAGMVYAAAAIQAVGGCAGDLVLVFTADEEAGSGRGSRWLAAEGHLTADAAIIGEPSGIADEWEAIHLVSRGAALFKIAIEGTQSCTPASPVGFRPRPTRR